MKMKLLALLALAAALAPAGRAQITGTMLVDGDPAGTVTPGQPALLTFGFARGPDQELIQDYDLDHGKYMHLIAVSVGSPGTELEFAL